MSSVSPATAWVMIAARSARGTSTSVARLTDRSTAALAPSLCVDEGEARRGRRGCSQPREQAHLLGDGECRSAHIDWVAAGALTGGALNDRRRESVAGEPVREGRAGHAGAGDEYGLRGHAVTV